MLAATATRRLVLRILCLAWIAGLCVAWVFPENGMGWAIGIVILSALSLFPISKRVPWKIFALAAGIFLGASLRGGLSSPPPAVDMTGKTQTLSGTVIETSRLDGTSSRFVVDTGPEVAGKVYVRSDRPLMVSYGEIVELTGVLEKPLDFTPEFSWRAYLSGRGIRAVMDNPRIIPTDRYGRSAVLRSFAALRERINADIALLLPHRSAALLSGVLMGDKASFPRSFLDDLQSTGLTHIVALSGFNITILIAFVSALLSRATGRYARFGLSVLCVILFILLVGPSASVVRAAVMGIVTLLALTVGRRANAPNMLLLALCLMTAYRPAWLFTDMGFQLSFIATLGIVLFVPLAHGFLPKKGTWRLIAEALSATLAAQLATLPFLLQHFGTVSLIAPLANLLVVGVIPPIMLLGTLAVLVSLVPLLGFMARALAFLAYLPLAYIEHAVTFFARLPLAAVDITWWNGYWTVGSYVLIAAAYWVISKSMIVEKSPEAKRF